jgi:hypothetical protein
LACGAVWEGAGPAWGGGELTRTDRREESENNNSNNNNCGGGVTDEDPGTRLGAIAGIARRLPEVGDAT